MIKLSSYEIMMPLDESFFLLVNGLYCAFDVVDLEEGIALAEGKFRVNTGRRAKASSHKGAFDRIS